MDKRLSFWARFVAPWVIVTVISLAPGPGFVTLAIPDDTQDSQNLALPDFPHLGKRTSHDHPLQIDAFLHASGSVLAMPRGAHVVFVDREHAQQNRAHQLAIRGPPGAA